MAATPAKAEGEAKAALTLAKNDVTSTGAAWAAEGKAAVDKYKEYVTEKAKEKSNGADALGYKA